MRTSAKAAMRIAASQQKVSPFAPQTVWPPCGERLTPKSSALKHSSTARRCRHRVLDRHIGPSRQERARKVPAGIKRSDGATAAQHTIGKIRQPSHHKLRGALKCGAGVQEGVDRGAGIGMQQRTEGSHRRAS